MDFFYILLYYCMTVCPSMFFGQVGRAQGNALGHYANVGRWHGLVWRSYVISNGVLAVTFGSVSKLLR